MEPPQDYSKRICPEYSKQLSSASLVLRKDQHILNYYFFFFFMQQFPPVLVKVSGKYFTNKLFFFPVTIIFQVFFFLFVGVIVGNIANSGSKHSVSLKYCT